MRSADIMSGELNLLRREQIIPWVLLGFIFAVVSAGFSGRLIIAEKRAVALVASEEARTLIDSLAVQAASGSETARSAGAVAYSVLSIPVTKAAAPLEGLAIGQSDLLPDTYWVTARGAHKFLGQTDPENSLRLVTGNFDVAFLIVWVLPLIAIGMMFDIVVGERERGVLSLACVAGASAGRFVWHKWWCRFLLLAAATTLAIVLAATIQTGVWTATTTFVLIGWVLSTLVYLALWCALAFYVSAGAASSESAATRLAAAWLVFVVLVPAFTNLLTSSAVAPPSRVALTAALREATEQADKTIAAERDQWFFDHPDIKGEMDRQAYYRSVARSEIEIDKVMSPLLEEFAQNARDQQRFVETLKYLSPGTLTFRSLTTLSGSDGDQHVRFRDAVANYHDEWRQFFLTRLQTGTPLAANDYTQLPRFSPPQYDWREMVKTLVIPLLFMIGLTLMICLQASRRLREPGVIVGRSA